MKRCLFVCFKAGDQTHTALHAVCKLHHHPTAPSMKVCFQWRVLGWRGGSLLLKYLLHQHDCQSLDLQQPHKRSAIGGRPIILALGGSDERIRVPCWSAILAELVSSRFHKRLCDWGNNVRPERQLGNPWTRHLKRAQCGDTTCHPTTLVVGTEELLRRSLASSPEVHSAVQQELERPWLNKMEGKNWPLKAVFWPPGECGGTRVPIHFKYTNKQTNGLEKDTQDLPQAFMEAWHPSFSDIHLMFKKKVNSREVICYMLATVEVTFLHITSKIKAHHTINSVSKAMKFSGVSSIYNSMCKICVYEYADSVSGKSLLTVENVLF